MEDLKNVVIVNDFDYIQGGASKVAIDTANLLVNNNDLNVYFFSGDSKETSVLDPRIIKVCTNQVESLNDKNKIRGMFNGIYNFKAKKALKNLLKTLNKDETIIHVHGWTKCLSSSVFDIAFKMNFKLVLTMHDYFTACPNGGYFNYKKNEICHLKPLSIRCAKCNCDSRNYIFKLYRLVRHFVQNKIVKLNYKLTDVISISDFSENVLKETLNPNTKIHRVYNPIDFDNSIINENFNNNDYYLNVGRLSPEKCVDMFCEAIKRTGVRGIVVGDGSEKGRLEKEYPEVEFVGWKNSLEVKQFMKSAKYLVFTSKWYEGAPLTTMEALMMGLPCIVWSGCAAIDQIEEGKNGFSFSSVEDLCDIILNKSIKKFAFDYKYNYEKDIIKCYEKIRKG